MNRISNVQNMDKNKNYSLKSNFKNELGFLKPLNFLQNHSYIYYKKNSPMIDFTSNIITSERSRVCYNFLKIHVIIKIIWEFNSSVLRLFESFEKQGFIQLLLTISTNL